MPLPTTMPTMMKAVPADRYGPPSVLRVAEMPVPTPRAKDILVRVRAATVTLGDCELRAFRMADWAWLPARLGFGVTKPRQPVLGQEFSGEVVAVGKEAKGFAIGDRVFGSTGFSMGAWAEYARLPASATIVKMPARLDFAAAAGIPLGGQNALHFLRHAGVKKGETLLVNGAGGSIGSFAVQLAKRLGAHVTAVDRGDKLELLKRLGADDAIDYERQDFWTLGRRWEVIVDIVGKADFSGALAALNENGRLMNGNPRARDMLRSLMPHGTKKLLVRPAGESRRDLAALAALVASGEIEVAIDRHFPLGDMRVANEYVEAGNKKGVVVIDT